ncbi:MAG: heme lyase CcmF/NrfE family subunit [Anaerolineae bacterium]|nr:heme lyase CcmF/NrfE family subunit [Anaerolineae bacterium]
MNAVLGALLLYVALACALYATIAANVGARRRSTALVESARNAAIAAWPLMTLSTLVLVVLLVRGDFDVAYVWSVTQRAMPVYLKVTALWGSQSGSLLFWAWLMSTFTAAVMLRNWRHERALMPGVVASLTGTLAFFLLLVAFWENPFTRWWQIPGGETLEALFAPSPILSGLSASISRLGEHAPGMLGIVLEGMAPLAPPAGSLLLKPADGQGLNPLLRHFGMVFHPPALYLGFVGFVVPYAFGFAALSVGDVSDSWIRATRRWTLAAWLFLSLGLILGGRWAYDVLGWGGYWGWDPVENLALMPWLTGTAFLHSVMMQERYGMLRRWNMALIAVTYLLVIVGTFLTRSGVLSSVHAFARSAIGPLFFLFVAGTIISSVLALVRRWDDLQANRQLDSLFSRETLFLLNNSVFVVITIAVAIGTFWPTVTEVLSGFIPAVERSSVGPGYYNRVTAPMFLVLLLLMGIVPLVGWGRAGIKQLGRAALWPIGITVLATVIMVALGMHQLLALVGYGLAMLAGTVTALEFHRGAVARSRMQKESYPQSLWKLFGRSRRRYGGYTIHLGVVIMAIGIISSYGFQQETQQTVAAGQTITLGDYVLEYENLERFAATDGRQVMRIHAVAYRNGHRVAQLAPRIDVHMDGQRVSIPATHTTLAGDDYYVLLVAWEQVDLSAATIKVYINPLVNWIWGGGLILVLGTLAAAWPDVRQERRTAGMPMWTGAKALER